MRNATGTITYTVFGPQASAPTTCTSGGTTVGTAVVSGNGTYNPSAGFTPTTVGNYWWYTGYSGDGNNNGAASTCGSGMSETIVVKATPTVTATGPSNGSAGTPIGASSISAVIGSSSGANASGTITFTLFGPEASAPATCTSGGTSAGSATVSGPGTYHPGSSVTLTVAGDYWWYVSYGGDTNNNAAVSTCGSGMSETVLSAGSAATLVFVQGPSPAFTGLAMSPAMTVQVEDAYGNAVADSGLSITLTPSSGHISSGAVASTNSSGLAHVFIDDMDPDLPRDHAHGGTDFGWSDLGHTGLVFVQRDGSRR